MSCVKYFYLKNKLVYLLFALQFQIILDSKDVEDFTEPKQDQVVIRAVFINCDSNQEEQGAYPDNEATRFQREELYKHSALQSCRKKLALTLKIVGEPKKSSGDEYIPIEHVFDGSNNKRVRLMDPYILRLRRESPMQAYKLRRIDTVNGVLTDSGDYESDKLKKKRVQRDLDKVYLQDKREYNALNNSAFPTEIGNKNKLCVKEDACTANSPAWRRDKRHEHNIIVEEINGDDKMPWIEKKSYYRKFNVPDVGKKFHDRPGRIDSDLIQNEPYPKLLKDHEMYVDHIGVEENLKKDSIIINQSHDQIDHFTHRSIDKDAKVSHIPYDSTEKSFALYEIGKPELWYTVHVQLFEKISTPDGKTVWNDITKGEVASVSSIEPDWVGQDINVKYRPTEWISKDQFTLPISSSLCLLVPTKDYDIKNLNEDFGKYIVVPKDDIVNIMEKTNVLSKRDGNNSDLNSETTQEEQSRRRVLIRVSRRILSGREEKMQILPHGSDHFLILPHYNPHHAQIDLEARADENELIRVGSSGSLITIVADNMRRTRSIITVQAMNKGLAAARFKVKMRDCGPELTTIIDKRGEGLISSPVLVAPRHTHSYRLELPVEIPVDVAHCSVALINEEEESIAVREVAIREGDRCFCVWHCDCVCINEDPKLQCREMTESRQVTAGLSPRERSRHARSACYPDVVTIDLFVIVVGVLMTLLMLGLGKAVVGVFCHCVSVWGLDYVIQAPRKLDHYYEFNLKNVPVVYDDEGWPVHPDTRQRTVRLVSKELEFLLNVILFIAVPSMLFWDAVKRMRCQAMKDKANAQRTDHNKKCFSTHDTQGLQQRWRRQRGGLRRWMTPQAEELSTNIWHNGLPVQRSVECDFMRPLLQERHFRTDDMLSSCVDSEQDDTEYVLTQIRKSKESLAKSQRRMHESVQSTLRKELNTDVATIE